MEPNCLQGELFVTEPSTGWLAVAALSSETSNVAELYTVT